MSWRADLIYTLPQPAIIDFFKGIPECRKRLFLVNDLEGIRSDYTRNFIFSDSPTESRSLRHNLPHTGLLAVAPTMYRTGYDLDTEPDEFWENNSNRYEEKWSTISNEYEVIKGLPAKLNLNDHQVNLFGLLQGLNAQTHVPVMYYKCNMWGGSIDEEFSVVFDSETFIYWMDVNTEKNFQLKNNEAFEIQTTALQKGLKHLGLLLPAWFFALHETSFNWQSYHIK
jgi:hypothetical protein